MTVSLCADIQTIQDEAKVPLLNEDLKDRKTAKFRLENGLEVYLISDPETRESAAALTVRAGSWDEPASQPGLAHFLEHMLFLGTEKYPVESEYDQFVSEHKGISNAFTYHDITAYMFSIGNAGFEEALDRFASFFKNPLFNPSGVSRELKAIDQEYRRNLNNDNFLESQVMNDLGLKTHPFTRFTSGNEESLKNASQEELKKWYREHYSSDRMRLTLYSNLPLDKMRELAIQDFKDVSKRDFKSVSIPSDVIDPVYLGSLIYVEPLQDTRTLSIVWDLPASYAKDLDHKPYSLACYVLGYEGENSLVSLLKTKGWIESLNCAEERLSQSKLFFTIQIELTNLGLKNKDEVIQNLFAYLHLLQEKGVSNELFREIQMLDLIDYQYQGRQKPFEMMMQDAFLQGYEPLATYPEKSHLITSFSPEIFGNFLKELTPKTAIYFLMAPAKLTNVSYDKKQAWTNTPYLVQKIGSKTLQSWADAKPLPAMQIPLENRFVPQSMALRYKTTGAYQNLPHPELVIDDDKGRLYILEDHYYQTPKVYWSFEIKTPAYDPKSPLNAVMGDIWVRALQESLNEVGYDAKLAGLEFTIETTKLGFMLKIKGYNDKAPLLMEEILKKWHLEGLTEEKFNYYVELLARDYENFQLEQPYKQAAEMFEQTIYCAYSTHKQKADAIKKVNYDKFLEYKDNLFKKAYIQGLVYGNQSRDEALNVWQNWQEALAYAPYPVSKQRKVKVIELPENKGPFYLEKTSLSKGHAIVLAVEDPVYSFTKRAAQQILQQDIRQEFFQELRTHQQTGYVVTTTSEDFYKHLFTLFIVQSNSHLPHELLDRIELFIESYVQSLGEKMPEARFETIRQSVIQTLSERPKNINDMGDILTRIISDYDSDFNLIDERIQALKSLSYEGFKEYVNEFLGRDNRRRVALLIKSSMDKDAFHYSRLWNLKELFKVSSFTCDE